MPPQPLQPLHPPFAQKKSFTHSSLAIANVNDPDQGRKLTNVLRKFALINVIKESKKITETTKILIDLSIKVIGPKLSRQRNLTLALQITD